MYRKSSVFLLVTLLSLCRIPLTNAQIQSDENPVSMLSSSNAILTVDVKRILSETASDILNNEPLAMGKMKSAMKAVEADTGVDPYKVNKMALSLNLGKNASEDSVMILQTESSTAAMAESIFQNQSANAKFSNEKNPVYNRLWLAKTIFSSQSTEFSDEDTANLNKKYESLTASVDNIQNALNTIKMSKTSAVVVENLKKSLQETKETLNAFNEMTQTKKTFDDLSERRNKLEAELEKIELTDTQRLQKISGITGEFDKLEKEFVLRFKKLNRLHKLQLDENSLAGIEKSLGRLPAVETRRVQTLQKSLKSLGEFQTNLQAGLDSSTEDEPAGLPNAEQDDQEALAIHPLYTNVSRRDETVGGKKILTVTTETKYNGEKGKAYELDGKSEKAIGLFNDTILVYGKTDDVKQILENKTTGQNQSMINLINRSPDSLAAFAFDLRDVDLSDFSNLMGDKPTVWQIYGSITAANKEISLTANVEKTDIPLKMPSQNVSKDNNLKIPVVENSSAATDILDLLAKTLIGVEGRLVFKFDKGKTAALLEKAPKLFGALLHNENKTQKKFNFNGQPPVNK